MLAVQLKQNMNMKVTEGIETFISYDYHIYGI